MDQILPDCVSFSMERLRQDSLRTGKSKRTIEFATGRRLAAQLLQRYQEKGAVRVAANRSPIWPSGFCGSISHSNVFVWVAISKSDNLKSLGIDTEPIADSNTRAQLRPEIASPSEWNALQNLRLDSETEFTVAFSAKESFYKCLFPLTGTYLGFRDVEIKTANQSVVTLESVAPPSATRQSSPRREAIPGHIDVYWLALQGHVFTAAWIPQPVVANREIE